MVECCLEHEKSVKLGQLGKSGLAEQCVITGHVAQFDHAWVLAKNLGFGERVITKSIEIRLHPYKVSRD